MKKLLLTVVLLLSANLYAFNWMPATMQIYVGAQQIQGQVFNNTPYALIKCRGRIFGRTQYNQVGYANFCLNIPRGGYAYAYLTAYGINYFTQGWSEVYCSPITPMQAHLPCY